MARQILAERRNPKILNMQNTVMANMFKKSSFKSVLNLGEQQAEVSSL